MKESVKQAMLHTFFHVFTSAPLLLHFYFKSSKSRLMLSASFVYESASP
jgi:hypothetical protein